ncbi:hypothetical protein DL240_06145 [Lujinxingia litoralis]|uniref:Putative glutamine amidotransferase domain-containing protein n=1 Tax=Lujinxingia litoralis TaxID=2211119 RepID=A0A328C9R9_9DELT|nr:glutamine amidotransferase [Lujinxingia litoralis]RAL23734.1 hypothetical protein DL240_06145 [Lujinxingia litoralis]
MLQLSEYNARDLLWLGDWSPGWIAALGVLGLAVLLFSAYDLRDMRAHRRLTLIGLRAAVFGLAVLMLLEPALDLKKVSKVKNHVAVLVDTSQTMNLDIAESDQRRIDRAHEALERLRPMFEADSEDHHFDIFTYGDELRPTTLDAALSAPADASRADLSAALTRLPEHYQGKDLGGIIVLSDGIDTGAIGRRVRRGEPLDEASTEILKALQAPVHTLAVDADAGMRDAAVTRVLHDDFAFVHNSLSVEVELHFSGLGTQTVPITLRRDGEILQSQSVQIHPEERRYKVEFEFVPRQIGKEVYTVDVPHFDDEALLENNTQHFVLRVIRDKVRVLQVVGRPSWDQRFLRQLLKRNPNVDLISFFILRTDDTPQLVPRDEMSLIPFPTDELFNSELGSFDLVIFQNFNFGPYNMARYLPAIADYVRQGGAFAMIGGDLSFASGGYARTPIESLLPVELPPAGPGATITQSEHFTPELTEAGHRHPITQLAFDPEQNRELWASLPALQGTNIVTGPSPGATVLATHPTLTYGGKPMPVIAVAERGEGRVLAITSDSTWRWGFEHLAQGGTPREYQMFWNSAIRWLIQDPELKLVRLDVHDDIAGPGQPVDASIRVFKPDYSPAANATGRVDVFAAPAGQPASDTPPTRQALLSVDFQTDASGEHQLDLSLKEPGVYHLRAEVETSSGTLSDENLVLVVPDVEQLRDIVPRNKLLAQIAKHTRAYHTLLPELDPGALSFNAPRFVEIHQRRVVQLWDSALLFLVILGLLGTEWSLRRRWGRL